jgi:hypothetical protein
VLGSDHRSRRLEANRRTCRSSTANVCFQSNVFCGVRVGVISLGCAAMACAPVEVVAFGQGPTTSPGDV